MSVTKLLDGPTISPTSKKVEKIVLFLHGYGANGEDLINIASEWIDILPNTIFYSPNAPFVCDINPSGYQWFKLFERTEKELNNGLKECGPYLNQFIDHIYLNAFYLHKENLSQQILILFPHLYQGNYIFLFLYLPKIIYLKPFFLLEIFLEMNISLY